MEDNKKKNCFDLISVIVPMYNVEQYIDRSINSLANQTYKNIEIILVDDGSTDNTLQKAREQQKKYANVNIISQINSGVSRARNMGLNIARGEYIAFCDPDDYMELQQLELMHKISLIDDADIVCTSYWINNNALDNSNSKHIVDAKKGFKELIVPNSVYGGFVWNKLYKRKIIEDVRFDENIKQGEDMVFNFYAFSRANRIAFQGISLYHYITRTTSASKKNLYKLDFTSMKCDLILFDEVDEDIKSVFYMGMYLHIIRSFLYCDRYIPQKERIKYLNTYKMNPQSPYFNLDVISSKDKIIMYMYRFCFILLYVLYKKNRI